MATTKISYGNNSRDLIAIVHPASENPEEIGGFNLYLYGKMWFRETKPDVVCELLEKFFTNNSEEFEGSYFGLNPKSKKEKKPLYIGPGESGIIVPIREVVPGLEKINISMAQTAYILENLAYSSLSESLPYQFEHVAQKISKRVG